MNLQQNRLIQTFTQLRGAGKKTLLPFLTAGYPDLDTTTDLLADLEGRGVRVCELGIPFSDPIADGPVIQSSYTVALEAGITTGAIFDAVRGYRNRGGKLALCAMVSYSIVFRRGVQAFCSAAAEAGFDALIVPDLPLGQAEDFAPQAARQGLCAVMLIAPTTPEARKVEIAKVSSGFVYYISVAGITGERDKLPPHTIDAVAELRRHTETPICVGFGISNPRTVANVCQVADGAIVGSAIIHRITDAARTGKDRKAAVRTVGEFVGELLQPIR
jgi:tryptophan synthase alpha chain